MPRPTATASRRRPALPLELRRSLGVVAVLAALTVAVLAVLVAGQSAAGRIDAWAYSAAQAGLPSVRPGALLIDLVGERHVMPVVIVVLAGLCLLLRHPRLAALAVAGPVVSAAGTTLLKPLVGRTINGGYLAYPSGHTAVATALAVVLGLLAVGVLRPGRVAGLLIIMAVAATAGIVMAWSQVSLNAHYATDTVGGFCSALAIVSAGGWLLDRIAELTSHEWVDKA